jgi:hypothetical protein
VTTAEAALVGASDGELTAAQLVAALSDLLGEPVDTLRLQLAVAVRSLVADGFLLPPTRPRSPADPPLVVD